MAATIQIKDLTATVDEGHWSSPNGVLAEVLQAMLGREGVSGADPNHDHTLALQAIAAFGGTIIKFDEVPFDPSAVY